MSLYCFLINAESKPAELHPYGVSSHPRCMIQAKKLPAEPGMRRFTQLPASVRDPIGHFFFPFKIVLKIISFASGLPYCWSLHSLVLSEQIARWWHRKNGLKAEPLHAWRDLTVPREGHGPTVCAKNRQIKPWAWALLSKSQKLVSISLCGGSAVEGGPGGPHTRERPGSQGQGRRDGEPGLRWGHQAGALGPSSPAVLPVPGCRPSSHVINRKRTITCPHAGSADQTPKGAEASGALSPLPPPRASGSHACACTRDTALGGHPRLLADGTRESDTRPENSS